MQFQLCMLMLSSKCQGAGCSSTIGLSLQGPFSGMVNGATVDMGPNWQCSAAERPCTCNWKPVVHWSLPAARLFGTVGVAHMEYVGGGSSWGCSCWCHAIGITASRLRLAGPM